MLNTSITRERKKDNHLFKRSQRRVHLGDAPQQMADLGCEHSLSSNGTRDDRDT
jgi:hypothetical protein